MLLDRLDEARHRHQLRTTSVSFLPLAFLGCLLGVITSLFLPRALESSVNEHQFDFSHVNDPMFDTETRPGRKSNTKCVPPVSPGSYEYATSITCLRLLSSSSTTLSIEISPPSLSRQAQQQRPDILTALLSYDEKVISSQSLSIVDDTSEAFLYSADHLNSCTEYNVIIESHYSVHPKKRLLCSSKVSTKCSNPPKANLIHNPSFEYAQDSPFIATRRDEHALKLHNPRQWTPFYDGGSHRLCGASLLSSVENHLFYPRSGNCALILGNLVSEQWVVASLLQKHSHYGTHTALALSSVDRVMSGDEDDTLVIQGWYSRWRDQNTNTNETNTRTFAQLIVSWTLDNGHVSDGISIPLDQYTSEWTWQPLCVQLTNARRVRIIHLYFHLDADPATSTRFAPSTVPDGDVLGIDDVTVSWKPDRLMNSGQDSAFFNRLCYSASISTEQKVRNVDRFASHRVHLQAHQTPEPDSLTLAVPLTADRVLRLETLARAYGGGGIVAAVSVRSEEEMGHFVSIWRCKKWLNQYVSVTFVRQIGNLGINSIRNIAVSLVQTQYVSMLDVDMIPATEEFSCYHSSASTMLRDVLPRNKKNVLAMAVLLPDMHMRYAKCKEEARNGLLSNAMFFYCVASQRASKLRQWFANDRGHVKHSRFLSDYEPYVIARRDQYPEYDERLIGYGFNKIAWLMSAQAAGWNILVSSDVFVTHLNHVEMDWVVDIQQDVYIQTWRRFLAMAAEVGEISFGGRRGVIQSDIELL